ncbi:hypothetical protein [Fervidobacterium sp.]|uniref:hypothetical protein n=1 Tax=Fervidobacterium sp. TaxID=1871331 RepID=UPI0025BF0EA2|nr:hypothetical protein [Fervidobacterium sp.]
MGIEDGKSNRASIDFVSFSFPKPNGKRFVTSKGLRTTQEKSLRERKERRLRW